MNRAQDEGPSTPPGSGKKSGIRMGRAYQAAFEATVAVVVAGAAGGFADQRFDTAPMFLIVGVLLGAAQVVADRALGDPAGAGDRVVAQTALVLQAKHFSDLSHG